jgi:hypothetical protein
MVRVRYIEGRFVPDDASTVFKAEMHRDRLVIEQKHGKKQPAFRCEGARKLVHEGACTWIVKHARRIRRRPARDVLAEERIKIS